VHQCRPRRRRSMAHHLAPPEGHRAWHHGPEGQGPPHRGGRAGGSDLSCTVAGELASRQVRQGRRGARREDLLSRCSRRRPREGRQVLRLGRSRRPELGEDGRCHEQARAPTEEDAATKTAASSSRRTSTRTLGAPWAAVLRRLRPQSRWQTTQTCAVFVGVPWLRCLPRNGPRRERRNTCRHSQALATCAGARGLGKSRSQCQRRRCRR
jgi:hypothetical protein